jgi:thiamine-phosphate pyrophosphorylase
MGTRLCIVTPAQLPNDFADQLAAALSAGDVASLIIDSADQASIDGAASVALKFNVATIGVDVAAAANLDGVHVESGADDARMARSVLGTEKIVGAGGVSSRHDAMTLGELLPDYVFFGRLDGDGQSRIHPRAFELARWWAQLFEIPAIVMGGSDVASVADAAAAGIEFVALRAAVWNHAQGPAAAVAAVNELLTRSG